jgi:hypothetical protein
LNDPNTRCIGGNLSFRRFAYLHKKDHSKFGLLEANDQGNARRHLGKQFHITATWLTSDEDADIGTNSARRWEIVSSIFLSPQSVKFVGKRHLLSTDQYSSNEVDRLRKRVSELERELENLMECTRVEIKESKQQ